MYEQSHSTRTLAPLDDWFRENSLAIVVTFVATAAIYNSFITGPVLTDHTLPNSFAYHYPSFKTHTEGRWLSDILIQILGGGSQVLQALLGFTIQSLNGVLFASLIGVSTKPRRIVAALLFSLHPALLDDAPFIADNVTFATGQTLALMTYVLVDRRPKGWVNFIFAASSTMLALAAYQPTVSALATVGLAWIGSKAIAQHDAKNLVRDAARAFGSVTVGVLLYFLSARLVIRGGEAPRTHISDPLGLLEQFVGSYDHFARQVFGQVINLPTLGQVCLCASLFVGAVLALAKAYRRSLLGVSIILAVLALMPVAVLSTYVVNDLSPDNTGRLVTGYAFAFVFLSLAVLEAPRFRLIGGLLVAGAVYGFGFIGVQENTYIAMKNQFETAAINRIVERIELTVPDRAIHPLVVLGQLPLDGLKRVVLFPNRPLRPHTVVPAFAPYRQVALTNFLAGQDIVGPPTQAQIDAALADSSSRSVWPLSGSVYLLNEIIVVVLSRNPGKTVTWPSGQTPSS